jgi:hypothetical protein
LAIVFLRERPTPPGTVTPEATAAENDEIPKPRRLLPIWIGLPEAHAIYTKIEGREMPRPLTHDLLANVLATLGAQVQSIVVHSLEELIFHGRIELNVHGKRVEIDSRPSDAIALALRVNAPIYVEDAVMNESAISENDIRDIDRHVLKDTLESLDEESYDEFKV